MDLRMIVRRMSTDYFVPRLLRLARKLVALKNEI
jgi:hypothetical protein